MFDIVGTLLDRHSGKVVTSSLVVKAVEEKFSFGKASQRVLAVPNAGGTSARSEAMSMELLQRMFSATLLATETSISYTRESSIVDFMVLLHGRRFGVSVTRAMQHDATSELSPQSVSELLHKKLTGVAQATDCVCDEHAWDRALLHVFVASDADAATVVSVYASLPRALHRVSAVLVTTVHNATWMFFDRGLSSGALRRRGASKLKQKKTRRSMKN
eukprot:TRINITY_DN13975_c0_g1_i1.p1 TRINITY_DN13975_c0_g1~~TRINITY_DN13975_c0_g1_i1.p1  ORF type:complete len:217 (-),score=51.28 TRINITY_DN13975_c0_g1_i1:74-724(-)